MFFFVCLFGWLVLVASRFTEQLNERKLNKAKRREGRLIVASRLRIRDIFQCLFFYISCVTLRGETQRILLSIHPSECLSVRRNARVKTLITS